jgi:hypothetical protein
MSGCRWRMFRAEYSADELRVWRWEWARLRFIAVKNYLVFLDIGLVLISTLRLPRYTHHVLTVASID